MRVPLTLTVAVMMLACSCTRPPAQRAFELPGLMLWAWQRPEDLTFINPHTTGVAYLAGTARISRTGLIAFEPRLQPLSIAPGTPILAVVRIQSEPHGVVKTAILVQNLKRLTNVPGARGLQIDFDARASERVFYRSLLTTLTGQSPIPVGVTALASWCEGDRWLDRAPIAEAVPMFFRMEKTNRATCGSPARSAVLLLACLPTSLGRRIAPRDLSESISSARGHGLAILTTAPCSELKTGNEPRKNHAGRPHHGGAPVCLLT